RRVLLVALGDLVRGERGLAARAVGGDTEAAVDQVVVPEALEDPPARLDITRVVGDVGVISVDPEADAVRHPLPLLDVAEDRLAALAVELLDAVRLDLRLRGEP